MKTIVISSGHGLNVSGAGCIIDEVDEARKVVNRVAEIINSLGDKAIVFHDNTSESQSENLGAIVDFHNSQERDLDVSVHFNCADGDPTKRAIGTECLYVTQDDLAADLATSMARAGGFINRGAKYRSNLAFLNGTEKPSVLLEVCFVDSVPDVNLYKNNFEAICTAIAQTLHSA